MGRMSSAKSAKVLKALVEVSEAVVPTVHLPATARGGGANRSQK